MTSWEEKRDHFAGSDGTSIFYRRLIPEKPRFRVVVSHGLGEHSGAAWRGGDFTALPRYPMGGPYGRLEDFGLKAASLPL